MGVDVVGGKLVVVTNVSPLNSSLNSLVGSGASSSAVDAALRLVLLASVMLTLVLSQFALVAPSGLST